MNKTWSLPPPPQTTHPPPPHPPPPRRHPRLLLRSRAAASRRRSPAPLPPLPHEDKATPEPKAEDDVWRGAQWEAAWPGRHHPKPVVLNEDDGGDGGVGRSRSLTDDDLEELKGCADLGFRFSYDEIPELRGTLPALELCYSMSQRLQIRDTIWSRGGRETAGNGEVFGDARAGGKRRERRRDRLNETEGPQCCFNSVSSARKQRRERFTGMKR